MSPRLIAATTDITSSSVLARRYRGKAAKEVYRCGKGMFVTGSIIKPLGFAIATIPAEIIKGFVYSTIGNIVLLVICLVLVFYVTYTRF